MTSIYDKIGSAKELVHEVMVHGFSTKQEDICRAQDIFGNATIEELDELANDIGRNNANGEPDPNGSWSSGRRETRSTFYSILFQIWNWEQATSFWNQHSNPEYKELRTLRGENKNLSKQIDAVRVTRDDLMKQLEEKQNALTDIAYERNELQLRAEAAEAENIKLKAKLYDLLIKD